MAARADLVLQQNVESAMINGTITTQIKGDKIRVDMPSSPQGAMSTIMDLSSGDSTTLLHQQKVAMKVPGAEIKQMAENLKQVAGQRRNERRAAKISGHGQNREGGQLQRGNLHLVKPGRRKPDGLGGQGFSGLRENQGSNGQVERFAGRRKCPKAQRRMSIRCRAWW